jgi:hypothetical protein
MTNNQQAVDTIMDELERNPDAINPVIERSDVHGTDITVKYNQRTLPKGFCELVGKYADVRIEGTNGRTVELLIQL